MTTLYNQNVWRTEVTATKVTGETQVSPIVTIPEDVFDLTLYVIASAATTGKVWESPSSSLAIQTATGDKWLSVDTSTNSVGLTLVRFALSGWRPIALKLESLTTDQTATMVVIGKRVR